MRRNSRTVPVNARMYRHFAVVTVLLTACIAVFADGNNRDLIAEQAQAQQAKSSSQAAEKPRSSQTKVNGFHVRNGNQPRGKWGNDTNVVGVGMDNQFDGDPGPVTEMDHPSGMSSKPPLPPSFVDGHPASEVPVEEDANSETTGTGQQARRRKPSLTNPNLEEVRQAVEASRERSGSDSSDDDPN